MIDHMGSAGRSGLHPPQEMVKRAESKPRPESEPPRSRAHDRGIANAGIFPYSKGTRSPARRLRNRRIHMRSIVAVLRWLSASTGPPAPSFRVRGRRRRTRRDEGRRESVHASRRSTAPPVGPPRDTARGKGAWLPGCRPAWRPPRQPAVRTAARRRRPPSSVCFWQGRRGWRDANFGPLTSAGGALTPGRVHRHAAVLVSAAANGLKRSPCPSGHRGTPAPSSGSRQAR